MYDFFISYNRSDQAWAEWIAWQLEECGYTTFLQIWDIPVGSHFLREMRRAHKNSHRTLVILSPAFLAAEFTNLELDGRLAQDPNGDERRLILVQVRPCTPDGLLKPIVYVDLVNLDEQSARRTLIACLPEDPQSESEFHTSRMQRKLKPRCQPQFPEPNQASPNSLPRDYSHLIQVEKENQFQNCEDELYSIAFSRDKKWVAAGSEKKVILWDLLKPQKSKVISGPKSYVYSVAFSHDSAFIACGCEDYAVRVWDVKTRKLLWAKTQHKDAVYSVSFSSDGTLLVSGGYDKKINVWDAKSGQIRFSYDHDIGRITSVAFSPTSQLIAIGSLDDVVRLWEPGEDQVRKLGKHDSSVEAIAFSPNGDLLASCGLDKYVCVWDIATGKKKWRKRQHDYLVRSVAFSPDGATLASAGWDKSVKLWDVETGKVLKSIPFDDDKPWHKDWIWSVAFSPDGSTLASSGSDGQVILWRVETSKM